MILKNKSARWAPHKIASHLCKQAAHHNNKYNTNWGTTAQCSGAENQHPLGFAIGWHTQAEQDGKKPHIGNVHVLCAPALACHRKLHPVIQDGNKTVGAVQAPDAASTKAAPDVNAAVHAE